MFKKILSIVLLSIFLLVNSNLLSQEKWLTSLAKAKEVAKKTNKDIFVNFTGSDWCKWCKRLDKEVFSTKIWQKEAPKKYVLVKIDFPKLKKLPKAKTEINQKIAKSFRVRAFPTICLLDSNGKIYAKTGYAKGGAKKYLSLLQALNNKKKERDLLINRIKTSSKVEDKLKAIDQLINLMARNQVDLAYIDYKIKAVELDPLNNYKMNEKYSAQLFYYFTQKENMTKDPELKKEYKKKYEKYFSYIKKFNPAFAHNLTIQRKMQFVPKYFQRKFLHPMYWKGKEKAKKMHWQKAKDALKKVAKLKPTNMTAQTVYYLMGISDLQLNNMQEAVANLKKAIKASPRSQLAKNISMDLKKIKTVKVPKKNK